MRVSSYDNSMNSVITCFYLPYPPTHPHPSKNLGMLKKAEVLWLCILNVPLAWWIPILRGKLRPSNLLNKEKLQEAHIPCPLTWSFILYLSFAVRVQSWHSKPEWKQHKQCLNLHSCLSLNQLTHKTSRGEKVIYFYYFLSVTL